MVFDAHDRAFAFFKGACTPASGWEKGQVENQVGLVRERFFTPRLRVKSYAELNAWLMDQGIAYAKAHRHPEFRDRTIWQVFEAERGSLVPYPGRFDGFHGVPASVSKTCALWGAGPHSPAWVRFDNNRYSVAARAVGRPVEIRAPQRFFGRSGSRSARTGAWLASIPAGSGATGRSAIRGTTSPSLPVSLAPCANGAPFKNWVLPAGLERVRRKLVGAADGDRQFVDVLTAVLSDGLPAVEAACQEALGQGVHSADVILNILARRRDPAAPITIATPRLGCVTRRRPTAPDTTASGGHVMERSQIPETMNGLKLFGMKAAYDEIIATAVKRQRPAGYGERHSSGVSSWLPQRRTLRLRRPEVDRMIWAVMELSSRDFIASPDGTPSFDHRVQIRSVLPRGRVSVAQLPP